MSINRRYRFLPSMVRAWMSTHGAWLVGSAAVYIAEGGSMPKDFDVIVPPDKFIYVAQSVSNYPMELTSFGGLRVNDNDVSADVWPSTLEHFIAVADVRGPRVAVRLMPYVVVRWER